MELLDGNPDTASGVIASITKWVAQELLPTAAFKATLLNVLLAFDPRVVIAATHTTIIRASMTAYSTAVGPSSSFRNRTRPDK